MEEESVKLGEISYEEGIWKVWVHRQSFNLAILETQGWNIVTNHDITVARVFEARYYLKGDFFGSLVKS